MCGVPIPDRHALALRCAECQRLLHNKRGREYRAKVTGKPEGKPEGSPRGERKTADIRAYDRARQPQRNARSRERYANDPEFRARTIAKVKRRYARLGGSGARKRANIAKLIDRDGIVCRHCGEFLIDPYDGAEVHVDHVKAVAHGGGDDLDNLQLLHGRCNSSKGARY